MMDTTNTRSARFDRLLRILAWGGALALWLLPLIAMRFTAEVNWGPYDFTAWGVMLLIACGLFEAALRLSGNLAYRAGAAVGVGTAFMLVWANVAVGVIGNEDHIANQMFYGVLFVGVAGAFLADFKALGLARAMLAMAAAQAAVAIGGALAGLPVVLPLTLGFAVMWLVSAWLFRLAARQAA